MRTYPQPVRESLTCYMSLVCAKASRTRPKQNKTVTASRYITSGRWGPHSMFPSCPKGLLEKTREIHWKNMAPAGYARHTPNQQQTTKHKLWHRTRHWLDGGKTGWSAENEAAAVWLKSAWIPPRPFSNSPCQQHLGALFWAHLPFPTSNVAH